MLLAKGSRSFRSKEKMKNLVEQAKRRCNTKKTSPIANITIRVPEHVRWYQFALSPLKVLEATSSSLISVIQRRLPAKTLIAGMKKTYDNPNPIAQNVFDKKAGACNSFLLNTVVIIAHVIRITIKMAIMIVITIVNTLDLQQTEKSR